jgi:hypothetical protein
LAYHSAKLTARSGLLFLPQNAWEQAYDITYDLHFELALDEYLSKDHDKAEMLFTECMNHAK